MRTIQQLCDVVREVSYAIHIYHGHGHGHLEKIYENALAHRLRKMGVAIKQQEPITVFDEDGAILGNYAADMLIEGCLLIEIKAVKTLLDEHTAQLLGYLKSTKFNHGLLVNFGSYKFQIKKFAL